MELETVLCHQCRLEFAQHALYCPHCGTAKNAALGPDPLLGTTVGDRYLLVAQIGQGNSGITYSAQHVTLGRRVAIKVLHSELSQDELAIERFRREATTVGDLDNDHVVEIYDFGRTPDGRLYIAMEYINGTTLAAVLAERGPLPPDEATDIAIQLGEILTEAHALGYVHRDLHPRNMILTARRTRVNFLKLADFGLAKLMEREGEAASTSLGMTFGDPHYMSPEQARGEPIDRRADIYSVGCIVYEMLSGKPPFHGDRVFDVLRRQAEETPVPLQIVAPNTPEWLELATMRCLAKDRQDRYITAFRFVEILQRGASHAATRSDDAGLADVVDPSLGWEAQSVDANPVLKVELPAQEHGRAVTNSWGDEPRESGDRANDNLESTEEERPFGADGGYRREEGEPNVGLSAAWYASGELLDEEDGIRAGRAFSNASDTPENTSYDGMADHDDDDDFYYDDGGGEFYSTAKQRTIGIAIMALVPIIVLTIYFWPSGDSGTPPTATGAIVPSTLQSLVDAGQTAGNASENAAVEAKVAELKAAELKAAELKAAELKAVELKAAELKAAELKAAELKAADEKRTQTMQVGKSRVSGPAAGSDRLRSGRVRRAKAQKSRTSSTKKEQGLVLLPEQTSPEVSNADQDRADTLARQAQTDLRSGDILGAASKFNQVRSLDPKNADAVIGLGEIALQQGAYVAAIGHFSKANHMGARSARLWGFLGEAYLGAGDRENAAKAFQSALRLNPNNSRALNGYSEARGN